jgi:ATP-binding cassette subfamily B protein
MSQQAPARRGPGSGPHMGFGAPPAKSKDFKGALKRLMNELGNERKIIYLVFAAITTSVTIGAFGPKILGNATNHLFYGFLGKKIPAGITKEQAVGGLRAKGENRFADMLSASDVIPGKGIDFSVVGKLLMLALALYLISSLLLWAQHYLMAGVTQRTVNRLRNQTEQKLSRLPLSYFDGQSRGDLISRATNDLDNLGNSMQQGLSQILNSVLTVVSILIMMLWISWELALVSLIAIPLSAFASIRIAKRSQKEFVGQWDWTGKLNGHIEEMFTGHSVVRVFGRRKESQETFEHLNDQLYTNSYRAQFLSGLIQPMTQLISNLIYVGISVLGGYRVATGSMTLGDVQAFVQYSRQFGMPLAQIAGLMNTVQSGVASAERIFELLDAPEEVADKGETKTIGRAKGELIFDEVNFSYTTDKPLIENFNLKVNPGQTVAIVGPTGAGKTTLVNLLMRFYEVQAGKIMLDGVDTRDLTRDELRKQFGMVLQDTWLFTGSIKENIAFGSDNPSEDEITKAATAANIDHFIRSLPEGFNTQLTDDSAAISNGERQLLTIARAFIADPAILILDEATSSVDTRTEVLVQQAMKRLRAGRTSFVIAHRLSTIRDADVILVLDKGAIVEQGSHSQLMANQGFYFNLYSSQFSEAQEV